MYHQAVYDEPLIFDIRGNRTVKLPYESENFQMNIPKSMIRKSLNIGDREEYEVVRHFTRLSQMNFGVDLGFYPLGSCTMKYNPRINEEISSYIGFRMIHPYQDEDDVQGALKVMYELGEDLKKITGMDAITLQPLAGSQGEFTGLSIVRAYFEDKGELEKRTKVVVPDSAHGSNPASANMAGFHAIEIKSNADGKVDFEEFKKYIDENTAAFMITNPNTLGIFEDNIKQMADYAHEKGALVYYDGANLNGIMTKTTPGKMGFDIVHLNLHKTFSTPHGGGGPGAGPVAVKAKLKDYLPVPIVTYEKGKYHLNYDVPRTIGKVANFYGNFLILLRAWAYIKLLGEEGLRNACETAVLNSNYMAAKISKFMPVPGFKIKKHEFVASSHDDEGKLPKASDIAKHLINNGVHAPTIYFPLIVPEALMIEPTESATKEEMDKFVEILVNSINTPKEILEKEPTNTVVSRIDDVDASRNPRPTYRILMKGNSKN